MEFISLGEQIHLLSSFCFMIQCDLRCPTTIYGGVFKWYRHLCLSVCLCLTPGNLKKKKKEKKGFWLQCLPYNFYREEEYQ